MKSIYLGGDYNKRKIITKFCISAHDLEIERGRYKGLKAEERICRLCKSEVEDEVHFLLKCPVLEIKRQPILDLISTKYRNFSRLDIQQKFLWLMSSEDHFIFENLYTLLLVLNTYRQNILS